MRWMEITEENLKKATVEELVVYAQAWGWELRVSQIARDEMLNKTEEAKKAGEDFVRKVEEKLMMIREEAKTR